MEKDRPRILLATQCFVRTYHTPMLVPRMNAITSITVHSIVLPKREIDLGFSSRSDFGKNGVINGRNVAETARTPKKRK